MNPSPGPLVIALGGNAISRAGEEGNIPQQFAHTRETAARLAELITPGRAVVITHGNGPQVGNVLRRVELAAREIYPIPLELCVADTQGGMGYMIAQCLGNELRARGVMRTVSTLITTTEVDANDPAFENPTKPIGPFHTAADAQRLRESSGWRMVEVPGHGFRRVVASPAPVAIVEIELVKRMVVAGELLVAAGGGGIPVARDASGGYVGVEAVIDKDRTAALLATAIDAALLLIVTSVNGVALDYGKPNQRFVDRMSVAEARRHLAAGQFPPGSMGPKIEAATRFLSAAKRPDAAVVICDVEHLSEAATGASGTRIVAGE